MLAKATHLKIISFGFDFWLFLCFQPTPVKRTSGKEAPRVSTARIEHLRLDCRGLICCVEAEMRSWRSASKASPFSVPWAFMVVYVGSAIYMPSMQPRE